MERNLCPYVYKPDDVFESLLWTRVEIQLDDSDRQTAIALIEDVIKGIEDDRKEYVLFLIAYAIQQELFKSKEIDVETIDKLALFYPRCVEVDDDPKDDISWVSEYDNFKLSPDEEQEEEEEDDDDEDDDEVEEEDNSDELDDRLKKREAAMKEMMQFKEAGMKELKRQSYYMGCSLKPGKEQEILRAMLSFFADNFVIRYQYRMEWCVKDFMSRVKGYISSTCKLQDLRMVRKAIDDVAKKMMIKADAAADQQLEMNTVPTNEEGIASPGKRLKQENRDCGIDCENAIPLNQIEQEEICLTPPEFEGMKSEECEIATSLYEPARQGEGNTVDVNFCLTSLCEDMKNEGSAPRCRAERKLAQP